jgi:hypothetical protein
VRPAGLAEGDGETDDFVALRRLPSFTTGARDLALLEKLCALWHCDAIVNQPIRANADTLACEIGHRRYSDAKAQWMARTRPQPAMGESQPNPLGQPFATSIAGGEVPRPSSSPRFAVSRTG